MTQSLQRRVFRRSIELSEASEAKDIEARSRFNAANLNLSQSEIALDASGAGLARTRGAAIISSLSAESTSGLTAGELFAARSKEIAGQYLKASAAARVARDHELESRSKLYAGRLLTLAPDYARALKVLEESADSLSKLEGRKAASIGVGIGDAFLFLAEETEGADRKKALQASAQALTKAVRAASDVGDARTESFARGVMGKLYLTNGDLSHALLTTRQALSLAQGADGQDIAFQWRGQLADIYRSAGDREGARELYESAIKEVEAVRSSLSRVDPISGRSLFRAVVEPIFLSYAEMLINDAEGEKAQSSLLSARRTIDSLKEVELEQYFQDDCVSGLLGSPIDSAPKNVAILYPIMLEKKLVILLEQNGQIIPRESDVSPEEITQTAIELRQALRALPGTADYEKPAKAIYSWLIEPIEKDLFTGREETSAKTIVIAPDAALRGVPLSVLMDRNGKHLVEKVAIASAISYSRIAAPSRVENRRRTALYAALGVKQDQFPQFAALEFVDEEIASAQEIFPGPVVLSDRDFTQARLSDAFGERSFDIVHFATHATFGGREDNSYLLAYAPSGATTPDNDGRIGLDELEAMISRARIRGGDIELMTLSACQTAAGNDQSVLGLAGVAFKSGARSVFASLWDVNDPSTAALVPNFYEAMRDGLSKSKALQAAQTAFINQTNADGQDYSHPYYWSPFILLGEWE